MKQVLFCIGIFMFSGKLSAQGNDTLNRLASKTLNLGIGITPGMEKTMFGLDKGDSLVLSSKLNGSEGTASLIVATMEGQEIFRKDNYTNLDREKISIPARALYFVFVYTMDSVPNKTASLSAWRIASPASPKNFRTGHRIVYDTVAQEVMKLSRKLLAAKDAGKKDRTTIAVQLPENTTFWVYWIGAGKESADAIKKYEEGVRKTNAFDVSDPLVLYGRNKIVLLPQVQKGPKISYFFTDAANGTNFRKGEATGYYKFRFNNKVSSDYFLVKELQKDLVIAILNNEPFPVDVDIRILAFSVGGVYAMAEQN